MIRKTLINNSQMAKRFCHHHSRTFPKETDWQKVGEVFALKFEIDKLKVKTENLSYDIYKLKNINTFQNIWIIMLTIAYFK